jgi:hypothetical protein
VNKYLPPRPRQKHACAAPVEAAAPSTGSKLLQWLDQLLSR